MSSQQEDPAMINNNPDELDKQDNQEFSTPDAKGNNINPNLKQNLDYYQNETQIPTAKKNSQMVSSSIMQMNSEKSQLLLQDMNNWQQQFLSLRMEYEGKIKELEETNQELNYINQKLKFQNQQLDNQWKYSVEEKLKMDQRNKELQSEIHTLRIKNEELQYQLQKTQVSAQIEIKQTKQRQELIEREKQQQIESLRNQHSVVKEILEKKIDTLNTSLTYKDQDLRQTRHSAFLADQQKQDLARQKELLESQLALLQAQAQEKEQRLRLDLQTKEQIHNLSIERMEKLNQEQKQKLQMEIDLLAQEISSKQLELHNVRISADELNQKLTLAETREIANSREAELWRQKNQSLENILSQEINEKEIIRNKSLEKELEIQDLRQQNNMTVSQLIQKDVEKNNLASLTEFWKKKAQEEEIQRQIQINNQKRLADSQINTISRNYNNEVQCLRSQVNCLNNQLDTHYKVCLSPYTYRRTCYHYY